MAAQRVGVSLKAKWILMKEGCACVRACVRIFGCVVGIHLCIGKKKGSGMRGRRDMEVGCVTSCSLGKVYVVVVE